MASATCFGDGAGARVDPELDEQAGEVRFDGGLADVEVSSDRRVVVAFGDGGEDFEFAGRWSVGVVE